MFVSRMIFQLLCVLLTLTSAVALAEDRKAEELTVIFVGDVMLDNGPGHLISTGKDPFAPCAETLASADFAIANLECVVGRGGEQILKNYVFRAAKGSVPVLKKHFAAISLANNHSGDYGPEGLKAALEELEKEKLPYFGAGRNEKTARKPLILEKKGFKIALLGYNDFNSAYYAATDKKPGTAPFDEAKILADIRAAKQEADFVLPYMHWGAELTEAPYKEHRQLARKMIEAGATAVMGAHAHITQTVEVHRGAPIVYGLGNFVFDYYPVDPPQWVGWIVKLKLRKGASTDFEMEAVTLDPQGVPHLVRPRE